VAVRKEHRPAALGLPRAEQRDGYSGPEGRLRRLTPAQRFMLVSLLMLLCGMAVIGWWISDQIESSVVVRSAYTTALYVDSLLADSLQGFAHSDTLEPAAVAELERILYGTSLGHEIVGFKVWSRDGRVLYSPDAELIGRVFPMSEHLQIALDGGVAAEVSDLDQAEHTIERARADRLLEIYSPLRADGTGQLIGAVEFYYRIDELEELISTSQRQSWLLIMAATATIYLLLGGFVRSASNTIVRQERELRAQVRRLTEVLKQNDELHERVRRASARTTALNEQMLRRISAELHDGPAQYLGLALLRLDRLAEACRALPERSRAIEDVTTIEGALQQAMQEVRSISAGLGLPHLAQLTLSEVVSRAVRAHERRTATAVELQVSEEPRQASDATKTTLYRVVQEGLQNAHRHAGGVGQRVEMGYAGQRILVTIADKGQGFAPPAPGPWGEHMGLAGMRDRVESLGGSFSLESGPGEGTLIRVSLPPEHPQDDDG
jgi:signal transduction histidine kinase